VRTPEEEEYQGLQIRHEPDLRSASQSVRDHWFHVYDDNEPIFRVRMRVRWDFAVAAGAQGHPVDAARNLARSLGLRWTHGLIDLDIFKRDGLYEEDRYEGWDALFGEGLSDDELRRRILEALRRMLGAEQRMSQIPSLDVDGLGDVLGVAPQRLRATISELALEGMIEGNAETFGHTLLDGACRITGIGLQLLRSIPAAAAAQPDVQGSRPPKEYGGRWRVVRSLGEGGQAHTFIVRDLTTGSEDWVLKRLKNHERLGRFQREVSALQRLNSPRIPAIEDYSVDDPPFVVSRNAGVSLTKLEIGSMPITTRLGLFRDVVEAIRDAHREQVIHRDVKPDNVVLGDDGAFVIDFGICQVIDDRLMLTSVDEAFGNAAFAAPECGLGSGVDCAAPSDVYSLGKLLYWLASDRHFILREQVDQAAEAAVQDEDPWIRLYIASLVRHCVIEDPSQRWTAQQLLEATDQVRQLSAERIEARDVGEILVWDSFWLGDEFNASGSRSATMPARGNPPADGDVATAFNVDAGGTVEVRELVLALGCRAGSGLVDVAIHEDNEGSPSHVIASFTAQTGSQPATLSLPAPDGVMLQPESRYWVSISVAERDAEVAWYGSAPQLDHLWTRIAERFDEGEWRAGDTRGGMALRVVGVLGQTTSGKQEDL
jgi:serine/threonine protein kinase